MDQHQHRILRQHVQTDALLGADAVPISESAPQLVEVADAPPTNRERPPTKENLTTAKAKPPAAEATSITMSAGDPLYAGEDEPLLPGFAITGLTREQKLEALAKLNEEQVVGCTKCGLCQGRTQTVFGEGDPDAEIMFIGEGPGQNEDEQGRPFVGRAGDLLNKMIVAMGFAREEVFIANIVKCRPPNNRAPTPAEVAECFPYLRAQIQVIKPKAIVTLGGPAAKALLQSATGITKLRGTWHDISFGPGKPVIPVMPTFHPAYLLRQYTPVNRKKVWSDLQDVLKKIGRTNDR